MERSSARSGISRGGRIGDEVILFDGVCNLCSALVQLVIRHDRAARFRFAAMQSDAGSRLMRSHGIDPSELETFVFLADGKTFTRSDAALEVASRMGGAWTVVKPLRFIPRALRDWMYRVIARNRYRWFGRKAVCMMPTPELARRFLV
jgi:predicted DCC family thiol-disulfide oxidoreductase YuxK